MSASIFRTGEEFAAEMDARDPLARYRELFCIPKKKTATNASI